MSLDKLNSLDKSRASKRTEIEDTIKKLIKSRSNSSASLYDKSINIEKQKTKNVRSDSPSLSSMSRPRAIVTNVLPDKRRISRKIQRRIIQETPIER